MDDSAATADFDACSERTRVAAQLPADRQDCLRRSRECLALSRKLLGQPVYPVEHVPPHNPFAFKNLPINEEAASGLIA